MAMTIYDIELWKVYLFCAAACTAMLSMSTDVLCLNEEGQLLLNWKQDHLDDPDNNLRDWNSTDSTPCFWNGVNCTENSVSALDFSLFVNLGGDINELSFAKLVNVTTLNVGYTSLSGTFPVDIVNCSKLVYLNLSWSYISGEVPANIINLQRLEVLDLTFAELEGTMVSRIGELQELRVLRLAQNHFEGQIPKSILSLPKLQELTLSENNWNGTLPLGFFTIPNLTVLQLGSNLDLPDTVPWPNFSLWESMEDLRLNGVKFPQALFPTGIFKMTKLKTLHLTRCNITGPIPSLQNMTHLEVIFLSNNSLTGHIPDILGGMPKTLKELVLYQNHLIKNPVLDSAWQCQKLQALTVWSKGLWGNFSTVSSGRLTWLDLGGNNLNSGEIPPSLGNVTLLTYVASNNYSFNSEKISSDLENLAHLTCLEQALISIFSHFCPGSRVSSMKKASSGSPSSGTNGN